MSLALWLRAGRVQRGLTVDDVAKVTKIQPRILERLESGKPEGLPADVFVRGFVRSFARCVGLDEAEALRRYAACALGASGPGSAALAGGTADLAPTARALVEAMAELVPDSAATAVRATPRKMLAVDVVDLAAGSLRDLPTRDAGAAEPAGDSVSAASPMQRTEPPGNARSARGTEAPIAEAVAASPATPAPVQLVAVAEAPASPAVAVEPVAAIEIAGESSSSKKKKSRRAKARERRAARMATGTDLSALVRPSDAGAAELAAASLRDAMRSATPKDSEGPDAARPGEPALGDAPASLADEPIATATWSPTMPPVAAPSVPWRKPAYAAAAATAVAQIPSLVIDDADPDSAERVLEARAEKHAEKHAIRRSFLPPILLDREDRSARQGGLTLAVIILLIAATLTLSYLMRRPGASGDGMTRLETPASYRG